MTRIPREVLSDALRKLLAQRRVTAAVFMTYTLEPQFFEEEVLSLGITDDPLTVAAELRVVRWEEQQAGERPLAELLDQVAVAEVRLHLPMGSDRAQVDDPNVPSRRLWLLERIRRRRHGRWL